ncbi:MAG TPA: serine/threonine-protein kinase [Polyangiaceae bacterium]|nr:serine/threonine-protein kinase [Polyangiaceae bacterium]
MTTDSKMLAASAGLRAALGHFGLVAEIGRGGMSSAFLALLPKEDGTSREVVLKQLRSEFCRQDGFRAMLENEAFLGTRFQHENVVETYDIYADRDLCVLAMEFLDGQTLSSVRERAGRGSQVPFAIHLRVLADALAGLHYVHELKDHGRPLGIVHRNVTPSNVFVTYDGRVKLIDFAIAHATLRDADTRMSGVVKGNIGYMSPEAVRRERIDRRTDIFSVGVMLWEAATGRRLWQGHDEIAVFRRLAAGDLPLQTPDTQGPSAEMIRIAARALAVDPSHRYATADEMRLEVENVSAQLGNATHLATLAAYMQTFFSIDRAKFRAVVDEAAAALVSSPPISDSHLFRTDVSASSPGGESAAPPASRTSPLASTGTFRTTSTSYDIVEPGSEVLNFRRRVQRIVGVACMPAAAAMSIAYAAHVPNGAPAQAAGAPIAEEPAATHADTASTTILSPPTRLQALPAPIATPGPGAAPAAAPAHGTISAVFLVHPAHAHLFLDGAPLEGNPAGIRRRPDDKPHLLRVEAPGYATLVRAIDLDRDVAKEFELAPEPTPPVLAAPRTALSPEAHGELQKSQPVKRTVTRDDPWGI